MDFAALQVFKAVADEGGISAAARKLHRVQSNVTTRIRHLARVAERRAVARAAGAAGGARRAAQRRTRGSQLGSKTGTFRSSDAAASTSGVA